MGSDSNCRNFYSEVTAPSSSYYENNERHSANPSNNTNNNNHHHNRPNSVVPLKTVSIEGGWISSDQSSGSVNNLNGQELKSEAQEQHSAVVVNELRPSKAYGSINQHFQIPNPQWNFGSTLSNSYRLYNDYHYIITPNTPQQCALVSPCSSSVPSTDSEPPAHQHHHIHPLQTTTHHLKKLYYQGSKVFETCLAKIYK
jgi:hypothetical protein